MNAATQVLSSYQSPVAKGLNVLNIARMRTSLLILITSIIFSGFAVIYTRDFNRRLFIEQQTLQKTHEALNVEWGQLLLEQSTWAAPARVQDIAQQKLDMQVPALQSVVMIVPQRTQTGSRTESV